MAQPNRASDDASEDENAEMYFAIINENPRGFDHVPLMIARDGTDNAIYTSEEKAHERRDDLAEKFNNETLTVKPLAIGETTEDTLSAAEV